MESETVVDVHINAPVCCQQSPLPPTSPESLISRGFLANKTRALDSNRVKALLRALVKPHERTRADGTCPARAGGLCGESVSAPVRDFHSERGPGAGRTRIGLAHLFLESTCRGCLSCTNPLGAIPHHLSAGKDWGCAAAAASRAAPRGVKTYSRVVARALPRVGRAAPGGRLCCPAPPLRCVSTVSA